jgi:hypothetical protein
MLEWSLNSKKKYVFFYCGMVNAMKIRVWILKRIEIMNHLPKWLGGVYIAPEPCHVAWMDGLECHFLLLSIYHNINER